MNSSNISLSIIGLVNPPSTPRKLRNTKQIQMTSWHYSMFRIRIQIRWVRISASCNRIRKNMRIQRGNILTKNCWKNLLSKPLKSELLKKDNFSFPISEWFITFKHKNIREKKLIWKFFLDYHKFLNNYKNLLILQNIFAQCNTWFLEVHTLQTLVLTQC